MLEIANSSISLAILVSGVVFYSLGIWVGFRQGVKTSSEITIDTLCREGYLRWYKDSSGQIQIKRIKDD